MKSTTALLLQLLLIFGLATPSLFGCNDDSASARPADGGAVDAPAPAVTVPLGSDAGPPDDTPPPPPQAMLRVAQLSPDLPAIDVCVAPHGTTTFARLVAPDDADAGSPGLAFAQVSAYFGVALGQIDARIVAAGSSCAAAGLVPDVTGLGPLANALPSTLLIAGDFSVAGADHGIVVTLLPDDFVLAGGGASLRAVNALASSGPLDFGLGAFGASFVPLLTNVAFGKASATAASESGVVDANGYLPIAPLSDAALSARVSSSPTKDAALAKSAQIPLGSVATAFAIGGKTGDFLHPPHILLCIDNAKAAAALSTCEVQP